MCQKNKMLHNGLYVVLFVASDNELIKLSSRRNSHYVELLSNHLKYVCLSCITRLFALKVRSQFELVL